MINMHYAFQDKETLFLALDFLTGPPYKFYLIFINCFLGGDLRYHISRKKVFTEE